MPLINNKPRSVFGIIIIKSSVSYNEYFNNNTFSNIYLPGNGAPISIY